MKEENTIQKIFNFIANILKVIIIFILNIIRGIFGKKKIEIKDKKGVKNDNIAINNIYGDKAFKGSNDTSLPDTSNLKSDNHNQGNNEDNSDNTTNDVILKLPKKKQSEISNDIKQKEYELKLSLLINELIDKELEETYKEVNFKVKDAPKEIEEKVQELKKKIIPKIINKIKEEEIVSTEEIKKEVQKTVKEELKEKPLLNIKQETNKNNPNELNPYNLNSKQPQQAQENNDLHNNIAQQTSLETEQDLKRNSKQNDVNTTDRNDIYFVAKPLNDKRLNIRDKTINKTSNSNLIANLDSNADLKERLEDTPIMMVQNVDEIPKQKAKDTIKNATLGAALMTAEIAKEMFGSTKEDKQKQDSQDSVGKKATSELTSDIKSTTDSLENMTVELEALALEEKLKQQKEQEQKDSEAKEQEQKALETMSQEQKTRETPEKERQATDEALEAAAATTLVDQTQEDLNNRVKSIAELTELQEKLEDKIEEIAQDAKENLSKDKEIVKDIVRDTELTAIAETSEAIIDDSIEETKKDEFEDKDYDRIERQIDKMLEDISNTYLRYESSMSPKQKEKLRQEEEKLRDTKEQIQACKEQDIATEQKHLDEIITSHEINGLQEELEKLDAKNKLEANEKLLKQLSEMENMTRDQVANVDKRIINKRLRKASFLLEMSSILALPFVRNKYFFYFTIGMIIDNHFNFINSFFNRRMNRYEPADLSMIRKGQDALNGALDLTYKNIVELDYIEQQALDRYPELKYDPEFVGQVTHLRTQLNNQYNKLMRKNKVMEKYYRRTKQQKKILRRDLESSNSTR